MNFRPLWNQVPSAVIAEIEKMFDSDLLRGESIDGGYSPMGRFKLSFKNGRHVFCKMNHLGNTKKGNEDFKSELYNYQNYPKIFDFGPQFLGDLAHPAFHFIFLEWCAAETALTPWIAENVSAVIQKILLLHNTSATEMFPVPPTFQFVWQKNWTTLITSADLASSWLSIFPDPEENKAWLEKHAKTLIDLEARGAAYPWQPVPIHLDLRSDNFLIKNSNDVKILDWPFLTLGPRAVDFAFWLPSLAVEGGPHPEQALTKYENYWKSKFTGDEILLACVYITGFFAFHCHQPEMPQLPKLREIQKAQFFESFKWLKRVLELSCN